MLHQDYVNEAAGLLGRLIAVPSVSRDERLAADTLQAFMEGAGLAPRREANNLWVTDPDFRPGRPTVLLNAHIDTVRPAASWQRDPFSPTVDGDRLYGLGSNDCGGGLVALLQVFRAVTARPHRVNLVYLASAEEEVSGADGFSRVLPLLPPVDMAIVGEPTAMQPAVAERGLMVANPTTGSLLWAERGWGVVECWARGGEANAARGEGVNAIYEALDDLLWLRDYRFERVSELLGPTRMSVTVVQAGTQHNVVPDECRFVIDVRTNELYTNEEVFRFLAGHTRSELKARSFRLGSSAIAPDHPLVRRCVELGLRPFGSPTLSDQALMPFPSVKIGPGDSARSHAADEYICLSELAEAISLYQKILEGL